ncbi:MAG: hypothetical protein DRJ37_01440 [Thermoprotei archaeon]|nr:MAG: hypothetical protein DRJ37_01440 [Thermoprotei archaeon]
MKMKWIEHRYLEFRSVLTKEYLIMSRYPLAFAFFVFLPYMVAGVFYGMGELLAGPQALIIFKNRTGVEDFLSFNVIGGSIMMISIVILQMTHMTIKAELRNGTLELNLVSPASRFVIFFAVTTILSLASFGIFVATTAPLILTAEKISLLDYALALIVLAVGVLPITGISFFIIALTLKFKEVTSLVNALNSAISTLSGVAYPIAVLPGWLKLASQLLPTSHTIELMRRILIVHRRTLLAFPELWYLAAMCLIYPFLGYLVFKIIEKKGRVTGEIYLY